MHFHALARISTPLACLLDPNSDARPPLPRLLRTLRARPRLSADESTRPRPGRGLARSPVVLSCRFGPLFAKAARIPNSCFIYHHIRYLNISCPTSHPVNHLARDAMLHEQAQTRANRPFQGVWSRIWPHVAHARKLISRGSSCTRVHFLQAHGFQKWLSDGGCVGHRQRDGSCPRVVRVGLPAASTATPTRWAGRGARPVPPGSARQVSPRGSAGPDPSRRKSRARTPRWTRRGARTEHRPTTIASLRGQVAPAIPGSPDAYRRCSARTNPRLVRGAPSERTAAAARPRPCEGF